MIPPTNSLSRIVKNGCCSGCGLCASVSKGSVYMAMSRQGFLRPQKLGPLTTETNELISSCCPGIQLKQTSEEGIDHPLWGPVVTTRIGASTDTALRHHSSSGGALSGLLVYLLESGMVDYVVQTAASENEPLQNVTVQSTSRADIYRAAGSRYAPSAPLSALARCLDSPGRFALVAKPCDVAAVRALSARDPLIKEKIPLLISFFCAGIPSIAASEALLDRLGVTKDSVTGFRYRGDGWPGRATATLSTGCAKSLSYEESWGEILSHYVQFRCKICPDGTGGFADIVCADAWHCDNQGYPLFLEEHGRSLILTRTKVGETSVRAALSEGYIAAQPIDISEVERMQPSQARRKRLVLSRVIALKMFSGNVVSFRGLKLFRSAMTASLWQHIRNFLGTFRRILNGSHQA